MISVKYSIIPKAAYTTQYVSHCVSSSFSSESIAWQLWEERRRHRNSACTQMFRDNKNLTKSTCRHVYLDDKTTAKQASLSKYRNLHACTQHKTRLLTTCRLGTQILEGWPPAQLHIQLPGRGPEKQLGLQQCVGRERNANCVWKRHA